MFKEIYWTTLNFLDWILFKIDFAKLALELKLTCVCASVVAAAEWTPGPAVRARTGRRQVGRPQDPGLTLPQANSLWAASRGRPRQKS